MLDNIHSLGVKNGNQNERIRPFQNSNHAFDCFIQSLALVQVNTDPNRHNFGISLTFLLNAVFVFQLFLEFKVIVDYAIVNEGDSVLVIEVRMSVDVGLVAVSCPSCMSDADVLIVLTFAFLLKSLNAISTKSICRCKLIHFELARHRINCYYSARIITS